jgi:hypothetical protein
VLMQSKQVRLVQRVYTPYTVMTIHLGDSQVWIFLWVMKKQKLGML